MVGDIEKGDDKFRNLNFLDILKEKEGLINLWQYYKDKKYGLFWRYFSRNLKKLNDFIDENLQIPDIKLIKAIKNINVLEGFDLKKFRFSLKKLYSKYYFRLRKIFIKNIFKSLYKKI